MTLCTDLAGDEPGWTDCTSRVLVVLALGYICNASSRGFIFADGPAKNPTLEELTKLGRCPQRQIEWHCQNAAAQNGKIPASNAGG